MDTVMTKKPFFKPECDIVRFAAEDILTTSVDNWDMGDQNVLEIGSIETP